MKKYAKIIIILFLLLIIDITVYSSVSFQYDKKQAKKYYESGDYSRAVSLYTNLIERDTNHDGELYISCADTYLAAGDYDSAIKTLNNALEKVTDKNAIKEKINSIKPNTSSKELKLSDDFETFSDSQAALPFSLSISIIILTLISSPAMIVHNKHKERQKKLKMLLFSDIDKCESEKPSNHSFPAEKKIKFDSNADKCKPVNYKGNKPRKVLVNKDFLENVPFELEKSDCDKTSTPKFRKMGDYELELYIAGCNRYVEKKDRNEESEFFNHEHSENNSDLAVAVYPENSTANQNDTKAELSLDNILSTIDKMRQNGWVFEKFISNLLLKNGFSSAEVTSGSNDYGVDVVAENKLGVRYAIQCKCYSNKLNNKPIQEINAGKALYNCQVGVVVTNNFFTDNAVKVAKANGILLWDRYKLTEFINNAINDISSILPDV